MAKRKKGKPLLKKLIIFCIITGLASLVLRILNNRLQVPEIAEINGYIGTAFAICLIIIIGIWIVRAVERK